MSNKIKASLGYIGRTVPWLADQLGLSKCGLYKKLKNPDTFTYGELRRMKEIFRWKTLEG